MNSFHANLVFTPGRTTPNFRVALQERRALREARDAAAHSLLASNKPEELSKGNYLRNAAQVAMENGCKLEVLRPGLSFA